MARTIELTYVVNDQGALQKLAQLDQAEAKLGQTAKAAVPAVDAQALAVKRAGEAAQVAADQQAAITRALASGKDAYAALGKEIPKHTSDLQKATQATAANVEVQDKATTARTAGVASWKALTTAVGAYLGARAIYGAIKSTIDMADSLTRMSQQTGISAVALQKLDYAAKQSGNSLDQITSAITMMQDHLGSGEASVIAGVKKLGLNFDALIKMKPDQQFMAIGRAASTMLDPLQRADALSSVFGRGWSAVLPTLTSNMQALGDEAERTHFIMDDKTRVSLDRFGDQVGTLTTKLKVLLAQGFTPLVEVLNDISSGPPSDLPWVDRWIAKLGTLANVMRFIHPVAAEGFKKSATDAQMFFGSIKGPTPPAPPSSPFGIGLGPQEIDHAEAMKFLTEASTAHATLGRVATAAANAATSAWLSLVDRIEGPGRSGFGSFSLFQGMKEQAVTPWLSGDRSMQGSQAGSLFGFTGGLGGAPAAKAASFWSGFDFKGIGSAVSDSVLRAVEGGGSIAGALMLGGGQAFLGALANKFAPGSKGAKAVGAASGALTGAFTGWQVGQQYGSGKGALAGAASGAAAGSVGGPWGMAIGAGVGAIAGYFGGKSAWQKQREEFIQAAGGLEVLNQTAKDANINIDLLLNTDRADVFKLVMTNIQAQFKMISDHAALIVTTVEKIGTGLASGTQLQALVSKTPFGGKRTPEETAALTQFMTQNATRLQTGVQKMAGGPIVSQGAATGITSALVASVKQMQDMGMGLVDILKALGPTIDTIATKLTDAGLKGSTGFGEISRIARLLKNEDIAGIVTSVEGVNDALIGMQNLGLMNQETFTGLGASVTDSFNALIAQGVKGNDALTLMQPTLQTLWQMEQDFGYKADDATQKLIDQGVASGKVGEAHRTATDKMMKALEDLIGRIGDLIDVLTGKGGVKDESGKVKTAVVKDVGDMAKAWRDAKGDVAAYNREVGKAPSVPTNGPPRPPSGGGGGDNPPGNAHAGGLITAWGVRRFHSGGLASNEMRAILQHGEYVMPKPVVEHYGLDTVRAFHRGGLAGRASGRGVGGDTHVHVHLSGGVYTTEAAISQLTTAINAETVQRTRQRRGSEPA